jgi:hypothetical protein
MRLYLCPEEAMAEPTSNNHRRLQARFPLGRMVITSTARDRLTNADVFTALGRHMRGDWGEVDEEDWASNEQALEEGTRLVSVYRSSEGVKFYIITEHDRSLTTILLPSDY